MILLKYILRPLKWLYSKYFYIRNKSIDYFDVLRLSKNVYPYAWPEYPGLIGSTCYGNRDVLKKALGNNFYKNSMIEHGLYFAEIVLEDECTIPCVDTIYTYSDYRKKSILKYFNGKLDKKIVTVGPYIKYAKNFKSKSELVSLKEKYGRILLVFPYHGFPGDDVQYDVEGFQKVIDEMSVSYDSVFVSMNGYDISHGNDLPYRNKGYKIVSSGTRFDPYFLNRQRDLIELSDMTISNGIGTHIGYCICLNRPHYVYDQKIQTSGKLLEDNINTDIRSMEYQKLKETFCHTEEKITQEQIDIVKYFWGEF
jgi:hypothetical protein